jgi:murein DD-endopeptidase MepM/ murein hydrolase activator NlpD
MRLKSYTFVIASSDRGAVRKVRVPFYAMYALAGLAALGGLTALAGVASYSRMLWKATSYNALRQEQDKLQQKYEKLQAIVQDSNQRLSSLQSLATEVAMTYGIARFRGTPFGVSEAPVSGNPETEAYEQSLEQFNFLVRNAPSITLVGQGLQLTPGRGWDDLSYTPSMWPVMGHLSGAFGERLDPFSGEGAFHAGVDISANYGDAVRATANGVVVVAENRAGFGRLVVVDHGFGLATWYGHLSAIRTHVGARVNRGEAIGEVGTSGRATGPHVHYEVRINNAPINPWRYLRGSFGPRSSGAD